VILHPHDHQLEVGGDAEGEPKRAEQRAGTRQRGRRGTRFAHPVGQVVFVRASRIGVALHDDVVLSGGQQGVCNLVQPRLCLRGLTSPCVPG
jgi:hypothetical protein